MNEIKTIHLARQPFTIAVDAYGDLKKYLDALTGAIKDKEVIEEIELRMAELLKDRKIDQDVVIVKSDVLYLKETLGQPSDFVDGSDESVNDEDVADEPSPRRRVMRDPRGQILGGVANGFASYFGLDPLWVRIAFIVLTFASGFGAVLYLILWMIMPVAKTSSDYLQMEGKSVTIDSITEFAEKADVREGAQKIGSFITKAARVGLKIALVAVAVGLIIVALLGAAASIGGLVVLLGYSSTFFGGVSIFPQGNIEIASVVLLAASGLAASVFMLFVAASIISKKWRLPGWATAATLTVFFVGIFTAAPIMGVASTKFGQRMDAAYAETSRSVGDFSKLNVGANYMINLRFAVSKESGVKIRVFGKDKDTSLIKTHVVDGTLTIDADDFTKIYACSSLCFNPPSIEMTVYGPSLSEASMNGVINAVIDGASAQDSLKLSSAGGATIAMSSTYANKVIYAGSSNNDGSVTVLLEGLHRDSSEQDNLFLNSQGSGGLFIKRANELVVERAGDSGCKEGETLVQVGVRPKLITVNNQTVDPAQLKMNGGSDVDIEAAPRPINCIMMSDSF
jgi:phage shock protein PspC (stress-responsive transcriptional regulator)